MQDEQPPKRLHWWQKPEYSPFFYGTLVFLAAEGYPIVEFLIDYFTSAPGSFTFETFFRGFGLAVATGFGAWLKNYGKRTVRLAPSNDTLSGAIVTVGRNVPNIQAGAEVTMMKQG